MRIVVVGMGVAMRIGIPVEVAVMPVYAVVPAQAQQTEHNLAHQQRAADEGADGEEHFHGQSFVSPKGNYPTDNCRRLAE
jgi:hypothetical protein